MNYANPIEYKNERRFKVVEIDESIHEVALAIQKVNDEDDNNEKIYKEYVREPIELHISSYGGSVYDGLALTSVMRRSKTPIHTYVLGHAFSMGFIISLYGHKRFADRYAMYMWHDIASVAIGKTEEMEQQMDQMKKLQKMMTDITVERTKMSKEKLKEKLKGKEDWYITADEAKKLGICDEII